jgi:hypothetical protein
MRLFLDDKVGGNGNEYKNFISKPKSIKRLKFKLEVWLIISICCKN